MIVELRKAHERLLDKRSERCMEGESYSNLTECVTRHLERKFGCRQLDSQFVTCFVIAMKSFLSGLICCIATSHWKCAVNRLSWRKFSSGQKIKSSWARTISMKKPVVCPAATKYKWNTYEYPWDYNKLFLRMFTAWGLQFLWLKGRSQLKDSRTTLWNIQHGSRVADTSVAGSTCSMTTMPWWPILVAIWVNNLGSIFFLTVSKCQSNFYQAYC